jgi:hypothetical protein
MAGIASRALLLEIRVTPSNAMASKQQRSA